MVNSTFNHLRSNSFPKWLQYLTFPPAVDEDSNLPLTSSILVIIVFFIIANLGCVVFPCGFALHFPNGEWCWTSFHVLIGHLYIFGERSMQVSCLFLSQVIFYCWVDMGWLRVGHNWATSLSLFTFMHWRRKRQPTPVFLPEESQRQRSLVGCCLWGRTELDTTEAT